METNNEHSISIPSIVDGEQFFKIKSCSGNKISAICIKCEAIICSAGNSSNFVTHLKRLHKDQLPKYEIYKANIKTVKSRKRKIIDSNSEQDCKRLSIFGQSSSLDSEKSRSQLQQELDQNIIAYIVSSMKPLSTVDDLGFRKIIQGLNSELEVMSSSTLMKNIKGMFEAVKEVVSDALKNADFVCTTADLWFTKHTSFLGSTAHYIDKDNFERKSVVLACSRFKGEQSSDKITKALYDINESYSLRGNKLVSRVTNNGSNFVEAFKTFGVTMKYSTPLEDDQNIDSDEEEELNFSSINQPLQQPSLPKQVPCGNHTLSLVATTDFNNALKDSPSISKVHQTAIEKCSALWNANRSPKLSKIIVETLESPLKLPCPTKWDSLYDAVKQLIDHREKMNEVLEKLNIDQFKEYEIDYLDQFCIVMKPISIALDKLKNESGSYYGMYIPTIISVHQQFIQLLNVKPNLDQIRPLIEKLKEAYEIRFKEFLDLSSTVNCAIIASCSHPNFKMRWVPKDKRSMVHSLMVCAMEGVHPSTGENNQETDSSSEDDFFSFDNDKESKYQEKLFSEAELELSRFLNTKERDLKILHSFPILKKVFVQYNTTLCSSAPVERLFSFGEITQAPSRAHLSDENLNKLVFLKGNCNFRL